METMTIGGLEISIEAGDRDREGRTVFTYTLKGDGIDYTGSDLRSGCGSGATRHFKGNSLSRNAGSREDRDGLVSLLGFLGAAGESYAHKKCMRDGSNTDLFPEEVCEWAYVNLDEIGMAEYDLGTVPRE